MANVTTNLLGAVKNPIFGHPPRCLHPSGLDKGIKALTPILRELRALCWEGNLGLVTLVKLQSTIVHVGSPH